MLLMMMMMMIICLYECIVSVLVKSNFWTLWSLEHGRPNVLWRSATPVVLGRHAVRSVRMTVTGIPNRLNYCAILIVCTCFTNVTVGRIIQPLGLQVGYHNTGVSGPVS